MSSKGTDTARILLVDDERAVRELARLILEHERWEVVEAGSLEEAAECIRAEKRCFDVFIVDLHLPDGLGTQLAQEIRRSCENARVIFTTGDPGWIQHLGAEGEAVLPKPFTPLQMIQSARLALAAGRPVAVVIEPGPVQRRLIQSVLEGQRMVVIATASVEEGLRLARERAAVVLLTVPPEDESALESLRELRKASPRLRVIALLGEAAASPDWCDGTQGTPLCEACLVDEIERVLESRPPGTSGRSEGAGVHQHSDRESRQE